MFDEQMRKTVWPSYIAGLEPDLSESTLAAVVPSDVTVQVPDINVPPDKARWSGAWCGWACQARLCDVKLVVENVTDHGATIVYAHGSAAQGRFSERLNARFSADELHCTLVSGYRLAFRMRKDQVIELLLHAGHEQFGGVLSQDGATPNRQPARIPTRFVENGKPVTLEIVIFKPLGEGPFPTVMFNHGSTGNGDKPALFTSTWTSPVLAKFFTDKGWLVAFPQRRGRGKSDGLYDEGFEADRSQYSGCPELSLPGFDRALTDIDAAVKYLASRPDVDTERMLIGGHSRGGILSVAYAAAQPQLFGGVINFVGGWVSGDCSASESINTTSFMRGASFHKPMLWLYGANDSEYTIAHSRKNYDAFVAAGGIGVFKVFPTSTGQDGHYLHSHPDLWREAVETYVQQLDLQRAR